MNKDDKRYVDIIDLPHFVSPGRHHMSNYERAAQFAPFDALTGYDEAIEETGRLTDNEVQLGEQEIEELDMKLRIIADHIKDKPKILIRYFVKDLYKEGGHYEESMITIKRIDMLSRTMVAEDKRVFDLDYIVDVKGDLLTAYFDNYL